ncbi:hypothetical protein BC937DRAFT_90578 [Endogone sp. FLAS-F59071]|nr:hypothetical protein BC937DRAFT_90578 [Endogone sp. FLAS-F59071]|eukprot:RUS22046.1 hypothetical protein BC937DRAFT_90578 [Endogone sp. FLAS-F59071]
MTSLTPKDPEYKAVDTLNIIYEAGLDDESRPILVLCASNLPDPAIIDYDLILGNNFVESDYVLVFLSAPADFRPGWMWILKAYRALDRKYKKNLKALYVVHLTRGYRLVFDLANKITRVFWAQRYPYLTLPLPCLILHLTSYCQLNIRYGSPKFARKLHYFPNLDHLNAIIPVAQLHPPQPVLDYDFQLPPIPIPVSLLAKYDGGVSQAGQCIFGRSLVELMNEEDEQGQKEGVPWVIRALVEHLRLAGKVTIRLGSNIVDTITTVGTSSYSGLDKEGLFRKSPSSEQLRLVKDAFNRGRIIDLTHHDVHIPAVLVKVFFRELPESLLPLEVVAGVGELDKLPVNKRAAHVRQTLTALSPTPYHIPLMRYLFSFLNLVAFHSSENLMTPHNIAVVFTPNLVHAEVPPVVQYPRMQAQSSQAGMVLGVGTTLMNINQEQGQDENMASAAKYLTQMGRGMGLVTYLVEEWEQVFDAGDKAMTDGETEAEMLSTE